MVQNFPKGIQDFHRMPVPPEAKVVDTEIYGMTGWYLQSMGFNGFSSVAFGGYFKQNVEEQEFRGELIDTLGNSIILGVMKDDFMVFDKWYCRERGEPIEETCSRFPAVRYFMKKNDEEWEGGYTMVDAEKKSLWDAHDDPVNFHYDNFPGRHAKCLVTPVLQDAFTVVTMPTVRR